jgi:hypothetical protein
MSSHLGHPDGHPDLVKSSHQPFNAGWCLAICHIPEECISDVVKVSRGTQLRCKTLQAEIEAEVSFWVVCICDEHHKSLWVHDC